MLSIGGGLSFVLEYFYRYTPNISEVKKGPYQTLNAKFKKQQNNDISRETKDSI